MLMLPTIAVPAALKPAGLSALALPSRVGAWCRRCCERYEQRRHLAELDERMLKDIGITPRQAEQESAKPFWRE